MDNTKEEERRVTLKPNVLTHQFLVNGRDKIMNKIKVSLVFAVSVFLSSLLTACAPKAPSVEQLLDDIPDDFLAVYYETLLQPIQLDTISFDIEKRDTDNECDNIYGTLTRSNDDYKLTAYCYFQYNYYDQGGWVLDVCQLLDENYQLTPLTGVPQSTADNAISQFYENYSLTSNTLEHFNGGQIDFEDFDPGYIDSFVYHISESGKYCTLSGDLNISYILQSNIPSDDRYRNKIFMTWSEIIGDLQTVSCDWDVNGSWYCSAPKGEGRDYELYLETSSFDGNTIYVDAVSPYQGSEYSLFGDHDRLEYIGPAQVSYNYDVLGDPVLSYEFTIRNDGNTDYNINVHMNHVDVKVYGCPTVELVRTDR